MWETRNQLWKMNNYYQMKQTIRLSGDIIIIVV